MPDPRGNSPYARWREVEWSPRARNYCTLARPRRSCGWASNLRLLAVPSAGWDEHLVRLNLQCICDPAQHGDVGRAFDEIASEMAGPDEILSGRNRLSHLQLGLNELPARTRRILLARRIDGDSYKDNLDRDRVTSRLLYSRSSCGNSSSSYSK